MFKVVRSAAIACAFFFALAAIPSSQRDRATTTDQTSADEQTPVARTIPAASVGIDPAPTRSAREPSDEEDPTAGGSGGGVSAIRIVFTSEREADAAAPDDFAAKLLLEGPDGHRTGEAPSGASFQEIPRSAAYDEGIEDPLEEGSAAAWRVIEVSAPAAGRYELSVQGTSAGNYNLSVRKYDDQMRPSDREFRHILISAGAVHTYALDLEDVPRSLAWARGGFDGGDEAGTVDQLLSYASVSQKRTTLPHEARLTALLVVYAETVEPSTLRATLSGVDVTDLFSPVPGGSEIVDVPTREGENTLILSVEGSMPDGSGRATDVDELIFVVAGNSSSHTGRASRSFPTHTDPDLAK